MTDPKDRIPREVAPTTEQVNRYLEDIDHSIHQLEAATQRLVEKRLSMNLLVLDGNLLTALLDAVDAAYGELEAVQGSFMDAKGRIMGEQ